MFNSKFAIVTAISALTIITAAAAANANNSNYDNSDRSSDRMYVPTQFYSSFGSRNDNHVHMTSGQEVYRPTVGGVYIASGYWDRDRYNDYKSASGSNNEVREYNKNGSSRY